jgi:hypothetical protein
MHCWITAKCAHTERDTCCDFNNECKFCKLYTLYIVKQNIRGDRKGPFCDIALIRRRRADWLKKYYNKEYPVIWLERYSCHKQIGSALQAQWPISDYNTLTVCWQSKNWNENGENYTAYVLLWWVGLVLLRSRVSGGKGGRNGIGQRPFSSTVATLVRFTGWPSRFYKPKSV